MIVLDIIDRLRAQASPPFALIEGAAELSSLGTGAPLATPAAYVFVAEEASAENERVTGVLQRTEIDLKVVLVTSNVSDAQGAAAAADIESLKAAARSALVGWQPPSADDVLTHVGGQMVRVRDGLVWWEMTLGAVVYIAGASS